MFYRRRSEPSPTHSDAVLAHAATYFRLHTKTLLPHTKNAKRATHLLFLNEVVYLCAQRPILSLPPAKYFTLQHRIFDILHLHLVSYAIASDASATVVSPAALLVLGSRVHRPRPQVLLLWLSRSTFEAARSPFTLFPCSELHYTHTMSLLPPFACKQNPRRRSFAFR